MGIFCSNLGEFASVLSCNDDNIYNNSLECANARLISCREFIQLINYCLYTMNSTMFKFWMKENIDTYVLNVAIATNMNQVTQCIFEKKDFVGSKIVTSDLTSVANLQLNSIVYLMWCIMTNRKYRLETRGMPGDYRYYWYLMIEDTPESGNYIDQDLFAKSLQLTDQFLCQIIGEFPPQHVKSAISEVDEEYQHLLMRFIQADAEKILKEYYFLTKNQIRLPSTYNTIHELELNFRHMRPNSSQYRNALIIARR
jgi:hypothetical protein